METDSPHNHPRALGVAIGLALLAIGGQPLVNYFSGDSSLKTVVPSAVVCLFGVAIVGLSAFWRPSKGIGDKIFQQLSRWSSSPLSYIIILAMVWIYLETIQITRNIELATVRNDEQSLARVLDRLVVPRHLTENQIDSIANFLRNYPAQKTNFEVISGDDEAVSYALDVRRALEKGGWTTSSFKYVSDLQMDGLSFQYDQTVDDSQKHMNDPQRMDYVIREAFGASGVPINGVGSGSGIAITEDFVRVSVGRRGSNWKDLQCGIPK